MIIKTALNKKHVKPLRNSDEQRQPQKESTLSSLPPDEDVIRQLQRAVKAFLSHSLENSTVLVGQEASLVHFRATLDNLHTRLERVEAEWVCAQMKAHHGQ